MNIITSSLVVCLLAVGSLLSSLAEAAIPETQVVRLFVSKRPVDLSSPWQFEGVKQQAFLGVMVSGGRLLTTAFAVADASLVEMQRFGSSRKDELDVAFVDYETNLAVLTPKDAKAIVGLVPVEFGDDLAIGESVDIYRARDAYQLARMPASLQEVGVFTAVTSAYSLISYQLKVQQTGLGWAEPVFQKGRLQAMTTGQDSDFVHAVPMSIIRHFLNDKHTRDEYRGFPSIGIGLSALVSPDFRRLLKAGGVDYGIRIAKVMPGGAFSNMLKEDDVLLQVGGVHISEYGYYSHPKWGKVHLKHLLNQRYGGDLLQLKILRGGVPMTVEAKLTRFNSNDTPVATYRYDELEPHVIFGGLVFQELTQEYLKQWGREWRDVAPLDLLYTLEYDNDFTIPGRRIIFLNRVLADDVNRGYGDLRRSILEAVNGRPIHSLADLREALAHPVMHGTKRYARLKFTRDGGEVILGYDGLEKAHARIAETYSVTSPDSFVPKPE